MRRGWQKVRAIRAARGGMMDMIGHFNVLKAVKSSELGPFVTTTTKLAVYLQYRL
jgi:hypothetical protein